MGHSMTAESEKEAASLLPKIANETSRRPTPAQPAASTAADDEAALASRCCGWTDEGAEWADALWD